MMQNRMLLAAAGWLTQQSGVLIPTNFAEVVGWLEPVAHLRLGESSGTLAADEQANYDGTYINTPTLSVAGDLTGDADTAVTFTAANSEYVDLGDVLDFDYDQPFSLFCLFKTSVTGSNQQLMGKRTSGGDARGYSLYQASDDKLTFILRNTTSNRITVTADGTHNDGTWKRLAVTYDGSTNASGVKFYIDGYLVGDTQVDDTLSATTLTSYDFRIGSRDAASPDYFDGSIDEVVIFDRDLTENEVAKLHWASKGYIEYPLEVLSNLPSSYWRLGEISGTNAVDELGTNDGTYVNTPTLGITGAVASSDDKAISLASASSEYVDMGDVLDFERTSPFSIEFMMKTSSAATQMIVTKLSNTTPYTGYQVTISAGIIKFDLINDHGAGNRLEVSTTSTYDDGDWKHVVITYDGSSTAAGINIYIDTILDRNSVTDALSATTLNANSFNVSGRDDGNYTFDGGLDEVVIYGHELSLIKIQNNYAAAQGHSAYYLAMLASAPVAYWRLWETSGTDVSEVIDSNNGTIVGGVTVNTAGATINDGPANRAFTFNGSTGYVNVPTTAVLEIIGAITLNVWLRKTAVPGVQLEGLLSKYIGAGSLRAYDLYAGASGVGCAISLDGGAVNIKVVDSTTDIYDDRWHMVTMVYVPSTSISIYIDAVLDTQATSSIPASIYDTSTDVRIGVQFDLSDPDAYIEGSLDEPAIWNRALAVGELETLYNAA